MRFKLPWSSLNSRARRGLLAHALHWQAVCVGQLYVGVYLFRLSHGYAAPAWHALCSYATVPLGSALGAALTRRWGPGASVRAGLFVYAAFQAAILALGDGAVDWAGSLGLWWGLGVGLYWQGWVLLMMDFSTEGSDRDTMMGGNQAASFFASLTAAPLAGYFLGRALGTAGYPWAFGLSFIFFAGAAWLTLPLKGTSHPQDSALRQLLAGPKPPGWIACMFSSVLMGVMTVGNLFLPMLLAYAVGKDEGLGGLYAFATALVGFTGSWAISRLGHPERRSSFLLGAALAVLVFSLPLALHRSLALVMLYGVGMALSLALFNVPLFAAHIRIIEGGALFARHRADAMALREGAIAVGRCGASAVVLWGVHDLASTGLTCLLVGVALTPLLNYLVMHRHLNAR